MPIEVRLYNNLFGSEGNVKPNRIPSPEKQETLPRQPTMYDFSNGYIKLYGDGNYAIYKGRHYFLEKLYVFDKDKKSYGYSMRLDYGMEALYRSPVLNGILDVSNNDELLEKHLQYTFPTLVDPVESTRINFEEQEHKWYMDLSIKKITNIMVQNVVTSGNGEWFLKRHRHEGAQKYKNDGVPNYFNTVNGTDAIYIFGYLKPTPITNGWKNKLARKINRLLDSLGEEYKIAKVNTPDGSPIVGKYCITSVSGGIGGGPENVDIDLIDLSGLKDIKEVRITDLEYSSITEEDFNEQTAVFDEPFTNPEGNFGYKVCRKFYGSFHGKNTKGRLNSTGLAAPILDEDQFLYHNSKLPGYGFNFGNMFSPLGSYYPQVAKYNGGIDTYQLLKFKIKESGEEKYVDHGITYGVDRINFLLDFSKDTFEKEFTFDSRPNKIVFPIPKFSTHIYDQYTFQTMTNAPGFGFLIYQTMRNYKDGNTIQYTGSVPIEALDVIVGINETFNTNYGNDKLSNLPKIVKETEGLMGNMGVLLFYLDMYLFTYLVPSDKNYPYGWVNEEGVRSLKLKKFPSDHRMEYVPYYAQADFKLDGEQIKNPYNEQRYLQEYSQKRFKRLQDVTIREGMALPGFIKKGDFFFSDMEYALSDINVRNPGAVLSKSDWVGLNYKRYELNLKEGNNKQAIATLGDFVRTKEENNQKYFDTLDKSIVLCSNKNKELEVRSFRYFKKKHTLDKSERQILHSVDDQIEKEIRYVHMADLGIKVNHRLDTIPNNVRLNILQAFYEFFEYRFNKGKGSWISDEQLENSTYDRLFDLEGTDGYCHLKKGKVSLIAKSEKIFKKLEQKVNKLAPTDKLKKLSLLEKINQRCYLVVHTSIKPLKTKFNFSSDSFFNVTLFTPKPTPYKDVGSNHYILQVKDKFDVVDREFLSIPKMPTDSLDIADGARIEQLRLMKLRAEQDYAIGTGELDLKEQRINEHFFRENFDIAMGTVERLVNIGKPLMMTGIRGYRKLKGLKEAGKDPKKISLARERYNERAISQGIRLGSLTTLNAITAVPTFIEDLRRAKVDREIAVKQLNFDRNRLDFRHERAKQDSFIHINSLSNIHRRGIINDALLVKEVNQTKDLNDGQVMNDVHMTVYTPSQEQLKYLIDHKERHGVDCFIPAQRYEFCPGMRPDVIRFKDLYSENISELDDLEIREGFLNMIYGGVKIVDVKEETYVEELDETEKLSAQLDIEKKANRRLESKNEELVSEAASAKEETKAAKAEVEKIKEKIVVVEKESETQKAKIKEFEDDIKDLEDQLKICEQNLGQIQKAKETCDLTNANEIKKLRNDIKELESKLQEKQTELDAQKAGLTASAARADTLSAEYKKLEAEKTQLQNLANLYKEQAEKAKREGCPHSSISVCELFQKLFKSSDYHIDIKERDNGFSAFTDLAFYIADLTLRMRRASIDFHLNHYEAMKPVFEKLFELEQVPTIDKAQSILEMPGYSSFVVWLEKGGSKGSSVDSVISATSDLKTKYCTFPNVHTVGAILDELNYATYKAKATLAEDIKNDADLDFFFKHIYPGQQLNDLYKKLFDVDPQFAITKKEFLKRGCVSGSEGRDSLVGVDEFAKTANINVPKASAKPGGLPPTAATVKMLDGREAILDENLVIPYFFPKPSGKPGSYKYLKKDGTLGKDPGRQSGCFLKNEPKNYPFYRYGRNGSGEYFYTGSFNDDDRPVSRPEDIRFVTAAGQSLYVRNLSNSNVFTTVHNDRKKLGENRSRIIVPDELKEAIKNKKPYGKYFYIRNGDDFRGSCSGGREYFGGNQMGYVDQSFHLDLVKTFGKKADDAYRLLGILDVSKGGFGTSHRSCRALTNIFDSIPAIEFQGRIMNASTFDSKLADSSSEFYETLNRNNIITDEFSSAYSLLNYIGGHIKNPQEPLRSVFDFGRGYKNLNQMNEGANGIKSRST